MCWSRPSTLHYQSTWPHKQRASQESMINLRIFLFFAFLLVGTKTQENVLSPTNLTPGAPLTRDELEQAARLPSVKTPSFDPSDDPMNVQGVFEGDIAGVNISAMLVKNAIVDPTKRWPSGIVPYVIGAEFDREERLRIAQAIIQFHQRTCVRLVPKRDQPDFIFYHKGTGCQSQVGRKGGQQLISLGRGCLHPGIIIHETLHAVGFWHEQSRADRDDHVLVRWENIIPGLEFNFLKYTWGEIQGLGEPYDLNSVMHYAGNAFSKNGLFYPTIIPRRPANIGQRDGFSVIDLNKVNKLYECGRSVISGGAQCVDLFGECPNWTNKGECSKNSVWMAVNCKKSCRRCGGFQKCEDEDQRCFIWAYFWQCQVNPNYMLNFCRKSCGSCSRDASVKTTPSRT